MNQTTVTEPAKKDSLGKTFVRGIIGGIGWTIGLLVGWLILAIIIVQLFNRFGIGGILEEYVQGFVTQTTQKQLEKQQNMLNGLIPSNLNIDPSKAVDYYQEDLQKLLNQNKK